MQDDQPSNSICVTSKKCPSVNAGPPRYTVYAEHLNEMQDAESNI